MLLIRAHAVPIISSSTRIHIYASSCCRSSHSISHLLFGSCVILVAAAVFFLYYLHNCGTAFVLYFMGYVYLKSQWFLCPYPPVRTHCIFGVNVCGSDFHCANGQHFFSIRLAIHATNAQSNTDQLRGLSRNSPNADDRNQILNL